MPDNAVDSLLQWLFRNPVAAFFILTAVFGAAKSRSPAATGLSRRMLNSERMSAGAISAPLGSALPPPPGPIDRPKSRPRSVVGSGRMAR